jgi:hypothetical protein
VTLTQRPESDTAASDAAAPDAAPPINVLFEEARHRRRRRWGLGLALAFVLVVTAATAFALTRSGRTSSPRDQAPPARSAPPAASARPGVAWVDYDGQLHIGSTATRSQRIVATNTGASATTPLTEADGRVYWVDMTRRFSPQSGFTLPTVHDINVATGVVSNDGPGQVVFLSSDRRSLMIERTATDLVAEPIGRAGPTRTYTIPFGWSLVSDVGFALPAAVPDGFVISRPLGHDGDMTLAVWQPDTGQVREFGTGQGVFAAVTPAGTDHSLLAWLPACVFDRPCPVNITDTADWTTVHVTDPLPYGFDLGGAFSSDGSRLVVFVRTNSGEVNPTTQMGIADTGSGRLRLVAGAHSNIGESVGWAQWLPGDRTVMGGALAGTDFTSSAFVDNHYLVNTRTLAAWPFTLIANRDLDVNFSAVAFPLPH